MNPSSAFSRRSLHQFKNSSYIYPNRLFTGCHVQGPTGDQLFSSFTCRVPFIELHQKYSKRTMSTGSSQKRSVEDVRVAFPNQMDLVDPFWPPNNIKEKPVVVILLGWAGSNHKQLSKYSQLYLKHGCATVSYISPISYTTFKLGKLPHAAEAVVKKLKESELSNHPTFIHVFSNNGAVMYSHILRELARSNDEIPVDLKGTIFDSAPVRRVFGPFMKMIPTLVPQLGPFRYPVAVLVTFSLAIATTWLYLKYALLLVLQGERIPQSLSDSKPRKEHIPLHNWLSRIIRIRNHPYLFLYSKKDRLLETSHVEVIAEAIKQRGNSTKMVLFSESDHVQHYRQYPKEYEDYIRTFIIDSMKLKSKTVYWDEMD